MPVVEVLGRLGTGCVSADVRPVTGKADEVEWRLVNGCPREQVVAVELGQTAVSLLDWPALVNVGVWPGSMTFAPTNAPFRVYRAWSEGHRWLVPASGVLSHRTPAPKLGPNDNPRVPVIIAACDARSASGHKQVIFRAAPRLADDKRVHCAPSIMR